METRRIISEIENGNYDNLFLDIYVDEDKISYQKQRYVNAIESYIEEFGEDDVEIPSPPPTFVPKDVQEYIVPSTFFPVVSLVYSDVVAIRAFISP